MKARWAKHFEAGLSEAQSGHYAEAQRCFSEAIQEKADRWEVFYARAWALLRASDKKPKPSALKQAREDLTEAWKLGGSFSADAAALMGFIEEQEGNTQEAIVQYLRALGRTSESELVEEAIARCLSIQLDEIEDLGVLEDGVTRCDGLQERVSAVDLPLHWKNGFLAEILVAKAYCLQQLSRESESHAAMEEVLRLDPEHPRLPPEYRKKEAGSGESAAVAKLPTFSDVGGREVKNSFPWKLCRQFENFFSDGDLTTMRQKFEQFGRSPTGSLLMFGPSGCGKTYVINAFAGEYKKRHGRELSLYRARLNAVYNKYVGEGEKALTALFDDALRFQPSILFIDEIDALGGARDAGQDWRASMTAHMLQEMDRLRDSKGYVLIIGCTNRLWAVEMALLRRFDEMLPVELPGPEVREKIFRVHLERLGSHVRPRNADYSMLSKAAHGLTPGDIEKAVRKAVNDFIAEYGMDNRGVALEGERLLRAVREHQNPMHVRTWLKSSVDALRKAGHSEMADEVLQRYEPFVSALSVESGGSPPRSFRTLPEAAWTESQRHDLAVIRMLHR